MKKLFSIACFITAASASYAQVTVTPEVGGNLNKFFGFQYDPIANEQHTANYDWMASPRFGVGIDIPIGDKGFSIEPALNYSTRTSRLSQDTDEFFSSTTTAFSFIELPVNLKYSWTIRRYTGKLFVQAAPYMAYGIGANTVRKDVTKIPLLVTEETTSTEEWGSESWQYKPLDYGAYVGIGYQFQWGLQARANYGISFANLSNYPNVVMNPGSVFSLTVGYVFGRKIAGRFY